MLALVRGAHVALELAFSPALIKFLPSHTLPMLGYLKFGAYSHEGWGNDTHEHVAQLLQSETLL